MKTLRVVLLALVTLGLGYALGYQRTQAAEYAAFHRGYCAGLDISDTTCREPTP